jgi:hypothetical protein
MASQKWLEERVAELQEKVDELTRRMAKVERHNEVARGAESDELVPAPAIVVNPVAAPKLVGKPKSRPKSKSTVKSAPAKQS